VSTTAYCRARRRRRRRHRNVVFLYIGVGRTRPDAEPPALLGLGSSFVPIRRRCLISERVAENRFRQRGRAGASGSSVCTGSSVVCAGSTAAGNSSRAGAASRPRRPPPAAWFSLASLIARARLGRAWTWTRAISYCRVESGQRDEAGAASITNLLNARTRVFSSKLEIPASLLRRSERMTCCARHRLTASTTPRSLHVSTSLVS